MNWFNEWFRYSIVAIVLLMALVFPVSAVTQYNWTVGPQTIEVWNETAGSTSFVIPTGITSVWYTVVAGGGGGGGYTAGGGAGGQVSNGTLVVTPGATVTVTVGAGGTGGKSDTSTAATAGGNSVFSTVTAAGGQYGGSFFVGGYAGGNGYNGGGSSQALSGGTGTNFAGGDGSGAGAESGGGGAGNGAAGTAGNVARTGGQGGIGTLVTITGTSLGYGGGGGGGTDGGAFGGTGGQAVAGYGGGSGSDSGAGTAGTVNRGGGGGGSGSATTLGGDGSAGFVAIRYMPPVSPPVASFTANATIGKDPFPVMFNDTSSGTPMFWQWNYTFSGVPTTFSTDQNVTYTFTVPGTYYIQLNATNYGGSSYSTQTTTITVNGFDAPTANYTINPTTGTPGALILFNDTSTIPNTNGLVYNWSFGTGSVELNPFSDVQGSVGHVYNYGGVYNINLTVSNYNGTSFLYTVAGVTISTEQRMTNWYSPYQVRFKVLDMNDNVIANAKVNATAYESSLPGGFTGAQQVLIEMYGINSISASQMVSSAVQMEGYTGDDGTISFTQHKSLKYLIYVVTPDGTAYTKTLYPTLDMYIIRVGTGTYTAPQDTTSRYTSIGNASLTFTEPNTTYFTMGVDYLDISGDTTNLEFNVKLMNNGTIMYTSTQAVVGQQHILSNYTVKNNRGQQWVWWYNATVT